MSKERHWMVVQGMSLAIVFDQIARASNSKCLSIS